MHLYYSSIVKGYVITTTSVTSYTSDIFAVWETRSLSGIRKYSSGMAKRDYCMVNASYSRGSQQPLARLHV
jgi:hypothetical protein